MEGSLQVGWKNVNQFKLVVVFHRANIGLVRYHNQIKPNLLLHSLYYAKACNNFAGPISTSLRSGNTATFKEISQRW